MVFLTIHLFECGAVERKYLKYYDCWIAGGRKDGRKDLPRPFEYYFFLKLSEDGEAEGQKEKKTADFPACLFKFLWFISLGRPSPILPASGVMLRDFGAEPVAVPGPERIHCPCQPPASIHDTENDSWMSW